MVAAAVVLVLTASCSDPTTRPIANPPTPDVSEVGTLAARALAGALAEPEIRQQILGDMRDSPFSEHKLVLQDYFATPGGARVLAAIERAGIDADKLRSSLQDAHRIQFYLPSTAQRSAWRGTPDVMVAPNLTREPPTVGFTPTGEAVTIAVGKGTMPSGVGALFVLQGAEPMFHRWAGPTAATETIQLPDESQVGSGKVVRDTAGTVIASTDDTPMGASRAQRSVEAAQAPGTGLTTLVNHGVCDNACTGEHLEFEFRSTASDDPNLYTSAMLSGIDPGSESDPSVWTGWWQVHTSRVINGVTMTVEVWEIDDWPNPDDKFLCQANHPNCHFDVTNWPYLIQGSSWSFPLCEDQTFNCTHLPSDLEVSFGDRTTSVVASVTVSPATATISKGLSTQPYTATARDQYGDVMPGQTASWASLNTNVATVASTGALTATATGVGGGTATIRATVAGVNGDATLTVLAPATLTLSPSSAITCPSGVNNKILTATVLDQNGGVWSAGTVGWSSSNAGIATATSTGSRTGNVAGVANGQVTVTAALDGPTGQASITVLSCPSVNISGPASVRPSATCAWFANVSNGTAPYHYAWTPLGNDEPELIYTNSGQNFNMQVWVTDANGLKGLGTRSITVSSGAPACQF